MCFFKYDTVLIFESIQLLMRFVFSASCRYVKQVKRKAACGIVLYGIFFLLSNEVFSLLRMIMSFGLLILIIRVITCVWVFVDASKHLIIIVQL